MAWAAARLARGACLPCLKRYFVDLRFISCLMVAWLAAVLAIMAELGVFDRTSPFVAFGPRPELHFMHVAIDTFYKYNLLIVLIVLHTFITDFISDSLGPHVLNIVQDPKILHIPHRPATYIAITATWSAYCTLTQIFYVFVAIAQLDLLLVRLLSDEAANFVTMNIYLHGKTYDPDTYHRMLAAAAPPAPAPPRRPPARPARLASPEASRLLPAEDEDPP